MANVYNNIGICVLKNTSLINALSLVAEHDDWTYMEVN